MAKKFGKFLLFTAALGSAVGAAYYYFKKRDEIISLPEDDDYDDFAEDLDEETDTSKNYVPLNQEKSAEGDKEKKEKTDSFVPLSEMTKSAEAKKETGKDADKTETEVEEFFDEGDADSEEEPPIKDN